MNDAAGSYQGMNLEFAIARYVVSAAHEAHEEAGPKRRGKGGALGVWSGCRRGSR